MFKYKSLLSITCSLIFLQASADTILTKDSTKVLYNGIELPEVWPPRYEMPTKAGDMPLPYLRSKPDLIPINTGRQLFVDDFLISETNLTSKYHTPNFYQGNPVLEPSEEWENTIEGAPMLLLSATESGLMNWITSLKCGT